eukprot:4788252-Pleurochrysis_carterae.AAC.1
MPTMYSVHGQMSDSFPDSSLERAHPTWSPVSVALFEPSALVMQLLIIAVWITGAALFIADTLLWYAIYMGLVGGIQSVVAHGISWHNKRANERRRERLHALAPLKLLGYANDPQRWWGVIWSQVVAPVRICGQAPRGRCSHAARHLSLFMDYPMNSIVFLTKRVISIETEVISANFRVRCSRFDGN